MDEFILPFTLLLARWPQITLAILGSVVAVILARYLGLDRPWPFPIILSGILSQIIMEAYPYAWTLGEYTQIALWVVMACMLQYLGQTALSHQQHTVWDSWSKNDSITDHEF